MRIESSKVDLRLVQDSDNVLGAQQTDEKVPRDPRAVGVVDLEAVRKRRVSAEQAKARHGGRSPDIRWRARPD